MFEVVFHNHEYPLVFEHVTALQFLPSDSPVIEDCEHTHEGYQIACLYKNN